MKKILAFGASNSKTSINKQLATYASSLLKNTEVEVLDLNDFDVPTYSVDLEGKSGIPDNAQQLLNKIIASDGLIISLAEHNGAYTAIFKSLFDWMSRIDVKLFKQKPMLLMSTSPGARGGQSVFEIAENRFPIHDANIVAKFSLPSFNDNFKEEKIVDADLNTSLVEAVNTLAERL
ncbi:NAD(P)H-dependent oxidoreductase [Olleya sp. Ti.3.14]|uniref:NADPH-dependent FMN reductase n=1 Tax=Olleya sp. Ti.3.14 TaxID=3121297 RepID=UPI00311E1542